MPPHRRPFPAAPALVLGLALTAAAPLAAQAPGTDIWVATLEADALAFEGWRNVTARPGYDNQPGFTPDGDAILYTSHRDEQTDIYRHDLASGATDRVTGTAESEYSATVMPGGDRFSVIRVEADSTQRLWSFALDGSDPELVLTEIRPVGYHAWIDEHTLGLFVLGSPATLQIADTRDGTAEVAASDIGRSLHRVPGRAAVSFLHRVDGVALLRIHDPASGRFEDVAQPVADAVDYAWTPGGVLLMGSGSRLFALDPDADAGWREVADLSAVGVTGITRLAVSPDGTRIAVVGEDAGDGTR